MVQKFLRKAEALALSGYGNSEFYQAIKDGRFPKPDGYLGTRSPFWAEKTVADWQLAKLAEGRAQAA